jgi:hypothetical protein
MIGQRRSSRHCDPNLLLLGPPRAATSVLACHLATLAPVLILADARETPRIPRVAGCTGGRTTLVKMRSYYPGICHPTAIHRGDGDETDAI